MSDTGRPRRLGTAVGLALGIPTLLFVIIAANGRPPAPRSPDAALTAASARTTVADETAAQNAVLAEIRKGTDLRSQARSAQGAEPAESWVETEPRQQLACNGGARALSPVMTIKQQSDGPSPDWATWTDIATTVGQRSGYVPALRATTGPSEHYLELRRSDGAKLVLTTSPKAGTSVAATSGCLVQDAP